MFYPNFDSPYSSGQTFRTRVSIRFFRHCTSGRTDGAWDECFVRWVLKTHCDAQRLGKLDLSLTIGNLFYLSGGGSIPILYLNRPYYDSSDVTGVARSSEPTESYHRTQFPLTTPSITACFSSPLRFSGRQLFWFTLTASIALFSATVVFSPQKALKTDCMGSSKWQTDTVTALLVNNHTAARLAAKEPDISLRSHTELKGVWILDLVARNWNSKSILMLLCNC